MKKNYVYAHFHRCFIIFLLLTNIGKQQVICHLKKESFAKQIWSSKLHLDTFLIIF